LDTDCLINPSCETFQAHTLKKIFHILKYRLALVSTQPSSMTSFSTCCRQRCNTLIVDTLKVVQ